MRCTICDFTANTALNGATTPELHLNSGNYIVVDVEPPVCYFCNLSVGEALSEFLDEEELEERVDKG